MVGRDDLTETAGDHTTARSETDSKNDDAESFQILRLGDQLRGARYAVSYYADDQPCSCPDDAVREHLASYQLEGTEEVRPGSTDDRERADGLLQGGQVPVLGETERDSCAVGVADDGSARARRVDVKVTGDFADEVQHILPVAVAYGRCINENCPLDVAEIAR